MAAAPRSSTTSPVMVGRSSESEHLSRAIDALAHGESRLIVISGEAGIGKTRLIDESLERAATVPRVLRAECLVLGSGIPYLPFAELLRDLARQVPLQTLSRLIGPARAELSRFLPELPSLIGAAPGTAAGTAPEPGSRRSDELERLRLYEAFLRVAERIAADQPSVFLVEDVQWIDRASLELLAFLAHGLGGGGQATLIISFRPEEVEDKEAVLALLADLGRASSAERIELWPLTAEATRGLISALSGVPTSSELAGRIHALSDGNPLFAEELLAAHDGLGHHDTLPPKLRDLLAARLARVPREVMAVLRVAAAAGTIIDDQLLAGASGLSQAQVRRGLRAAVDDHILVRGDRPARPGYRFRHEILRTLVADQLLPAEASRIHAAFAQALAEGPARQPHLSEIANHWDAAGVTKEALRAHIEAGQAAVDSFAFEQAYLHYARALALWELEPAAAEESALSHLALTGRAASAAARAGRLERAIALTREITANLGALDVETYQRARSSLRWYLWESGDVQGALDEAQAVVDDDAGMPQRWRANALAHLGALLLYQQRAGEAEQRTRQARDTASAAGATEEQILAEGVLGWCLLLKGDIEPGLAAIRRALEAAEDTEADTGGEGRYPVGSALAHTHLAAALELVGRFEEAHAVAIEGIGVARGQGVGRTYGSVLEASAARALYQLGRWPEARTLVETALDDGAIGSGRILLLALQALLATVQGRREEADQALSEADGSVEATTPLHVQRWLSVASAERSIWQRDPLAALTRLAFVAGDSDGPAFAKPGGQPAMLDASIPCLLASGARACADLSLAEQARRESGGFSAVASQQIEASLRRAQRHRALATARAGDLAMARAELDRISANSATRVRRWKSAVSKLSGRPYAAAYAQWRLAEALLGRRDGREAAVAPIESALAVAARLSAVPLQQELTSLARRARMSVASEGGSPSVSAQVGQRPFGLTEREAEVLVLLADGMSNQEIADRLFISPKTASVHVSNIYAKLGVESRVAAATTAYDLGLVGPSPADD